ncbi:MAG: rod shape-determining protein MreD [Clostridiales bacterium]|nr:rod shape-determining protein MreD [Clostridiales bacterium]
MRVLIVALVIIVNFILQTTVFGYIEIIGVKPNTMLVIIAVYAILRGDVEGAIVGLCAGFLQDLFFSDALGHYALLGALLGFFCGKPFKNFYREHTMLPLLLTAGAIMVYEFVFYVSRFLFEGKVDLSYYFIRIILPETVYTMLFALPVYHLVFKLNNFLEKRENSRRKFF